MKTDKLWETYQHYSRDLTEHARKLAFAAAAICWFFKSPRITFPPAVMACLSLLVLFFILDVIHHLWGATRLRRFLRRKEAELYKRTGTVSGEIEVPRSLDDPIFYVFVAKSLALLTSFGFLAGEFFWRIFLNPNIAA